MRIDDLLGFLGAATTPYHAVREMSRRFEAAGFIPCNSASLDTLAPGEKRYIVRNDSSIIAFVVGNFSITNGVRLVGAHTDSPNLALKPNPIKNRYGCLQLAVDVYGGVLLNPWFDRDLSVAGRVNVVTDSGMLVNRLIDFRVPIAVIPSLAIHLDREANTKRSINPQTDILPILAVQGSEDLFSFETWILEQCGVEHPSETFVGLLDFELSLYDSQSPTRVGINNEFLSSARLDNLVSCYAGMQALIATSENKTWSFMVGNDHEEVGSASVVGAQGPMLSDLLASLAGDGGTERRLKENSWMLSVDNAHAVHPNFASKHDDNHAPTLGGGPVIKVNRNQRYATSGEGAARIRLLAQKLELPLQTFVNRTDLSCGSTIGPLTSTKTGIDATDIGVPTLAMHSVRELACLSDIEAMITLLTGFFRQQA